MIKGLLALKLTPPQGDASPENGHVKFKWDKVTHFVPNSDDILTSSDIDGFMEKLYLARYPAILNIRHPPNKYYFQILPKKAENEMFFLLFILDIGEGLEIVQTPFRALPLELGEKLGKRAPSGEIKGLLQTIVEEKNALLDKLVSEELLKKQIGTYANQLIDANNYKEAQDLMKIANAIPEKLVATYKQSLEELKTKNYKFAEKSLNTCHDLAGKIEDNKLQAYLTLKMKQVHQIPTHQKEFHSLFKMIRSGLKKEPTFLDYQVHLKRLHRIVMLLDKLEIDDLDEIIELEDHLTQAYEMVRKLARMDFQIKQILRKIKINF